MTAQVINGEFFADNLFFSGWTDSEETALRIILADAYQTSSGAAILGDIENSGGALGIWIDKETTLHSNTTFDPVTGILPTTVHLNLADTDLKFVDDNGMAHSLEIQRILVHEMIHAITEMPDPIVVPQSTETQDTYGAVVNLTNQILPEMGIDTFRAGYDSVILTGVPGIEDSEFTNIDDFTGGESVSQVLTLNSIYANDGGIVSPVAASTGGDLILGTSQNDTIFGNQGNDFLYGGSGNDRLDGGDGDDQLFDGTGADVLTGGEGNDIYELTADDDSDLILVGQGYDIIRGGDALDRIAILATDLPKPPTSGELNDSNIGYSFPVLPPESIREAEIISNGGDGTAPDNMAVPILGPYRVKPQAGTFNAESSSPNFVYPDLSYYYSFENNGINPSIHYGAVSSYSFSLVDYDDMQSTVEFQDDLEEFLALGLQPTETTIFFRITALDATSADQDFESWFAIEDYSFVELNGVNIGDFGILDIAVDPDIDLQDELEYRANYGEYIDTTQTPDFPNANGRGGENFEGDNNNNNQNGTDGGDDFAGFAGNDTFIGGDGEDHAKGGSGDDVLQGDSGNDILIGGTGNDSLFGGLDNDRLNGGAGADDLNGGDGIDTAAYSQSDVGVVIDLLLGTFSGGHAEGDTLQEIENVVGSEFDDTLTGDGLDNRLVGKGGIDSLFGGDGDDRLLGGLGGDILNGGAGVDWAIYTQSADGVVVDLENGIGIGGDAAGDTLAEIENVRGSDHDDQLIGNDEDNRLVGGEGDDNLEGGAGDDRLLGNGGNNTLDGGEGSDWAIFSDAEEGLFIDLIEGTAGSEEGGGGEEGGGEGLPNENFDTLISVENIVGTEFDDEITGNDEDNNLVGRDGDDLIFGNEGNDRLVGDEGNDELIGGDGNDRILGGTGSNLLTGGSGNDIFVFNDEVSTNTITDFEAGVGIGDRIKLSDFDFADFAAVLAATEDTAEGALITLNSGTVLLEAVTMDQLVEDDFIL